MDQRSRIKYISGRRERLGMRLGTCITDTFLLPAGSYCHGNEETHWMLRPCVYCDNGVRVCVCVYVIVSPVCMCTSSTATSDNLKFVYTDTIKSCLLYISTRLVVMFPCPYIPNHRQCIIICVYIVSVHILL